MNREQAYGEVAQAMRSRTLESGEAVVKIVLANGSIGIKHAQRSTWIEVPMAVRPGAWGRIIEAIKTAILHESAQ